MEFEMKDATDPHYEKRLTHESGEPYHQSRMPVFDDYASLGIMFRPCLLQNLHLASMVR